MNAGDGVALSLFSNRIGAIADEMGAMLRRSAFSPNIRDRLDYSCAVFDIEGALCAQAAHIPVHLGSMAYAMRGLVHDRTWSPGDMVVVNDPYMGGTHLPDVTLIAPVFVGGQLSGFVANRAHHASIGSDSPGSMPIASTLAEEGLVISPALLVTGDVVDEEMMSRIATKTADARTTRGDFSAQVSANRIGVRRLTALIERMGADRYHASVRSLHEYGLRFSRVTIEQIPDGVYTFEDCMDDDGQGHHSIPVCVRIEVSGDNVVVDLTESADQVQGNINCPLPVTAAAVYYVFRCLMPARAPVCQGLFEPVEIRARHGSFLHARSPGAVAAGNVETSSRIVDVLLGALAQALPEKIPAASQGTMNNLAMGSRESGTVWDYYETVCGGMGAGKLGGGLDAVQTHMTNTLNTPVEVLEMNYPIRIERYAIRVGSGGTGQSPGGDGVVREFRFLAPAEFTILSERRSNAPWGLASGAPAACGENRLNDEVLGSKVHRSAEAGDVLSIRTPGGGGWGSVG